MAAGMDGFIARRDGRVSWMDTSDESAGGETMDPALIETFLKSIRYYVMGSRTYGAALGFPEKGLGWAWSAQPVYRA